MAPSTKEILSTLTTYRLHTIHAAEDVVKLGESLIERGWLKSTSSDDIWVPLEQIAVAAIECGRIELAEVCCKRLSTRFPDSPRVEVLLGQLMEGKGMYAAARSLYEKSLVRDESDVRIRKRLISLHLNHAPLPPSSTSSSTSVSTSTIAGSNEGLNREKGLRMLVEYLDTYYSDAEGWAEAASVYSSLGLYQQALSSLSHLILLLPHNPYHLLHHAELAYTVGDYPLAYKEFLRVVEMSDGVTSTGGVGRRAAMGVKLCIARLATSLPSSGSLDPALVPQKTQQVDLLVTKLVLDAYGVEGASGAGVVRKWIGGGDA